MVATVFLMFMYVADITNYSMGIPAYTCFVMVAVYMAACILVTVYQMIHPQALCLCKIKKQ